MNQRTHDISNSSMATTRTETTHGITYSVSRAVDITAWQSVAMPKRENMMNVCMCEVEHGVFTPLCCLQLEVLAVKLPLSINAWWISSAESKQLKHYSNVISWLRCRLAIAIGVRSAIMCVRGSCSSHHCPGCEVNITLTSSEGLPM